MEMALLPGPQEYLDVPDPTSELRSEEPSEVIANETRTHKDEDHQAVSADNVKIEIIDDEESDMISNSEVEQVNSLLEYKNEEVRFIENELEIQKQKYFKLQTFVRNLILAMKADDKEQQQVSLMRDQ
ncbi:Highly divergent homeobox [Cricetulus griseus]|nr:Highly divergent homeobox [Cricetulus griseus]